MEWKENLKIKRDGMEGEYKDKKDRMERDWKDRKRENGDESSLKK